jgi:hypothetical protein
MAEENSTTQEAMSFFPGKFLNSFNVLVKELEAPI